jgi:ABC-type molybdate transport system substrate-binding protein
LVDGANFAEARRFLAFLETPEIQKVFRKYGFTLAD